MLSLYVRMMTRGQDVARVAQKGAVASEYAILLALVALALVTAVTGLGTAIGNKITSASTVITN